MASSDGTLVLIESAQNQEVLALKSALQDRFAATFDRSRKSWNVALGYRRAVLAELANARVPYTSTPDPDAAGGSGGVEFVFRPAASGAATGGGGGGRAGSPPPRSRSPVSGPRDEEEEQGEEEEEEKKRKKKKKATTEEEEEKKKKKKKKSKKRKTEKKARGRQGEAETVEKLVSRVTKAPLVEAYNHMVQLSYPRIFEFTGRQYGGGQWLPHGFAEMSIRDVRRLVVRWLHEHPNDLPEFRRRAEAATLRIAAAKPAKPAKSARPNAASGAEAELALHVSKQTKPELVAWLLQNDRDHGKPRTKAYYADQKVTLLRELAVKRAAHSQASQTLFRDQYLERTADTRDRLEQKRRENRRAADAILELLRATRDWLTPGRRLNLDFTGYWTVYGPGSGAGSTNTESVGVPVEVVAYVPDPAYERDLARAKPRHKDEVPDTRLTLRVLADVSLLPKTPRYPDVASGQLIELAIGHAHSRGGTPVPAWSYPASPASTYSSSGVHANIARSDILEDPLVRHAVLREAVGDQAKPARGETLFVSVAMVLRNSRS